MDMGSSIMAPPFFEHVGVQRRRQIAELPTALNSWRNDPMLLARHLHTDGPAGFCPQMAVHMGSPVSRDYTSQRWAFKGRWQAWQGHATRW
jgi:hypothetical protein